MIPRRLYRVFAPLVVLAVVLGTTSCSSTTNDAATVTYKDKHGTHTIHITRADFETEMRALAKNKTFLAALANPQVGGPQLVDRAGDGKEATDADLTAAWLQILIAQKVTDTLFKNEGLKLSAFDKANASPLAAGVLPSPDAAKPEASFLALPKSFQKTLTDRAARTLAVARSTCNSGKALGAIVVATKAEADSIVSQLKNGASFNQLVRTKSIDPQTKASNGLSGCFDPSSFGQYGAILNAAAPNKPVDPIQVAQNAYAVFVLTPWNPAMPDTQASAQKSVQEQRADVTELLLHAHVHLDPRYGTWQSGVTAQGPFAQVVPPDVPKPREQREAPSATTTTIPSLGG